MAKPSAKLHPLPRNAPRTMHPSLCWYDAQLIASAAAAYMGSRDHPICRNPSLMQVSAALCIAQPQNSHARLPVSGKPGSWEGSSRETLKEKSMPNDVIDTSKGVWHLAEEKSPLLCRTKRTGEFPDPDPLASASKPSCHACPPPGRSCSWGIHSAKDRVLDAIGCHRMLVMRGVLPIKRCRGKHM